jgi:hypothetical protein
MTNSVNSIEVADGIIHVGDPVFIIKIITGNGRIAFRSYTDDMKVVAVPDTVMALSEEAVEFKSCFMMHRLAKKRVFLDERKALMHIRLSDNPMGFNR